MEWPERPASLPEGPLPVRFENVHFAYSTGGEVLSGIELDAAPGEIVAVCGPTGAGKTSLLNLLPRFYDPTEGRVLIGNRALMEARGVEIDALQATATERGIVLTLGDVMFTTGRADLKAGTVSNLDRLVAFLNQNPGRKIEIEGHTDNVGSDDSNLGLSQRRADSVKSYLVQQGIEAGRIVSSGKGEHQPVADNESEGGRQRNRGKRKRRPAE